MPNPSVPAVAEGVAASEIVNAPGFIGDSVLSELLGLQDQLEEVGALITLVDYALMGMSGDDDGSVNALQAGMTEILKKVISVSMTLAEIRTRN